MNKTPINVGNPNLNLDKSLWTYRCFLVLLMETI